MTAPDHAVPESSDHSHIFATFGDGQSVEVPLEIVVEGAAAMEHWYAQEVSLHGPLAPSDVERYGHLYPHLVPHAAPSAPPPPALAEEA